VNAPLPISVVIPAYNRADRIATAVKSALAQVPRPPAEVLVVDDASTDGTAQRAEAAGATVIRHKQNKGVSGARNTGIERAQNPWVAFLDSDDRWLPHHLERVWERAEDHVLVAEVTWSHLEEGGRYEGTPKELPLRSPVDVVVPQNPVCASGTLVSREVLLEVGGFPEGMTMCEDLDTWIRVLERGEGLVLATIGVIYEIHAGQVSQGTGMRNAHRDVVLSYSDRPWLTRRVRTDLDASLAWDGMGRTLKSRDYPLIARTVLRAVGGPRRIAMVRRMRRLEREKHKITLDLRASDLT
jgi:glycosyltransferase involved in cell wall biosynthesis